MTENRFDEAIYWLNEAIEYGEERHNAPYEEAIQALEEIEQYRELGTVEHIQLTFELCKGLDAMAKMYQSIGTIKEFKALKEKNEPKKVKGIRFTEAVCPKCESELFETYWAFGGIHYCSNCGQKLDWS